MKGKRGIVTRTEPEDLFMMAELGDYFVIFDGEVAEHPSPFDFWSLALLEEGGEKS